MPVKFVCDECRRMLSISRRKIGTSIDCPCCGHGLHVPTEADAEARIEELEERREMRRLKKALKFPDLAVFDEPRGASAAPASSLSDPRTSSQAGRKSRRSAKAKAAVTVGDDVADHDVDQRHAAEPPADTDWTNGSRLSIDDSEDGEGHGERLSLPPVATPKRRKTARREVATESAVIDAGHPAVVPSQPAANERLDRHRKAKERRGRWLKALGIMVFGVALFLAGWLAGRAGVSSTAWMDSEITISGGVMYTRANGETAPDIGAVVVALPVGTYPQRPVDISGLLPGEEELSPNHAGVLAIEEFGGAYARADATGEFQLKLPGEGKYRILMVSAHSGQPATERISLEDDAELTRYFSSGAALVGKQRYRLTTETIGEDPGRVSHLFQVGG